MSLSTPKNFELSLSKTEIDLGIKKVSNEINTWYHSLESNKNSTLIALCVLRGGVFFYADLLRQLDFNLEMEFVKIVNYNDQTNLRDESKLEKIHLDFDPTGKTILIIDDICESGVTLKLLSERLLKAGASIVKSAVLVRRAANSVEFKEDFFACEVFYKDYLVGYGFDDKKLFRHLPDVYKIVS